MKDQANFDTPLLLDVLFAKYKVAAEKKRQARKLNGKVKGVGRW